MKGAKHGEYSANFYTSNTTGNKQPSDDRYAPIASLKLQLNGQDRFQERKGSYFSQVQPFSHLNAKPAAGVYMYNFGIAPDQTQPSGKFPAIACPSQEFRISRLTLIFLVIIQALAISRALTTPL